MLTYPANSTPQVKKLVASLTDERNIMDNTSKNISTMQVHWCCKDIIVFIIIHEIAAMTFDIAFGRPIEVFFDSLTYSRT